VREDKVFDVLVILREVSEMDKLSEIRASRCIVSSYVLLFISVPVGAELDRVRCGAVIRLNDTADGEVLRQASDVVDYEDSAADVEVRIY